MSKFAALIPINNFYDNFYWLWCVCMSGLDLLTFEGG